MKIAFKQIRSNSGTDIWTDSLSASLRRQGVECTVTYYPTPYGFFPQLLKGQNSEERPADITHCNTWNGFAFKDSCPMVVTEHHVVHDPILKPYKSCAQRAYHRLIYRYELRSLELADYVTCVSEYTRDKLEQTFGYSDAKVIYNGIDVDMFQPQEINRAEVLKRFNIPSVFVKDKTILLFVGNPSRRKGVDLLPKIMSQLSESHILLVTSGLQNVQTVDNRIISVGNVPQNGLPYLYNLCDILLFPSRLEGFGLAVAEAMACKKPVVTTNQSSLPELIVNEKGGFLCEADNIKDYVEKVRLLEDADLRCSMGKYNRSRVLSMFTSADMTKNYLKLYQSLK